MDKALYVAMSAAKNTMIGQSIRANNLANANTTGFMSDFEQARSMSVYYGEGEPTRAYALAQNPSVDFTPGAMMQTGRDMDIALNGRGFIAVEGQDGQEAYVRAGNLSIDVFGNLLTGNGLPVIGNAGPINLPDFDKFQVGTDGVISIVIKGSPPDALAQVDRVKLVNPDLTTLVKKEDGLLYQINQEEVLADPAMEVSSGFLESSNVNPVEEMIRVMTLSRQYEMSVKIMNTAKQNSETSAQLLQMN